MKSLLCVFIIIALPMVSLATNYYVDADCTGDSAVYDPTAEPGGSCTGGSDQAYDDIQSGLNALSAGDTLYIRGGTYQPTTELDSNTDGGSEINRITIDNYESETVIIDGQDTYPSAAAHGLLNLNGNYTTVRDITFKDSLRMGVRIDGNYSRVVNCIVYDNMEHGIFSTADYSQIDGNTVYGNVKDNVLCDQLAWDSGISCARSPDNCVIKNNSVYQNYGEGLSTFEATNTTIQDNIIYDNYSANLYISDATGTLTQRNFVYDTGFQCGGANMGIAVSSEGQSPEPDNNTIINNIVWGAQRNFYFYDNGTEGLSNSTIAFNTFVNSKGINNFRINESTGHTNSVVKNNIIRQDDSLTIAVFPSNGVTPSNNVWSDAQGDIDDDAEGANDIYNDGTCGIGTPSASASSFKLSPGASAIDAGVLISGVTDDYFGTTRPVGGGYDIGAHEFVGTIEGVSFGDGL